MHQPWDERFSAALRGRRIWIWQSIVALAAVVLVATFAFAFTFTSFGPWDDDGYFFQAYHDFLSGHVPYDQVFAYYGPFTFFSAALVARFDATNVTHDNFRWVLLAFWVVIALLIAGIVWHWTGRYGPTLIAFLLVGFRLQGLAVSVGHPQLWIILAVAVLLWLGLDWMYFPAKRQYSFWMGFVIGVILLCKVNIGIFVCIAIALGVSLQLRGRLRALACSGLMIAAAGLGLLLFFISSIGSEKYFALAYLGSLVQTLVIAIARPTDQQPSLTSLRLLLVGLGLCLCAGIGVTLSFGTTLGGLFKSLVTNPILFARAYHNPFLDATRPGSILLSVVALGFAIGIFYWRGLAAMGSAWLGLIKVVVGAGLLCAFFYSYRQALTGSLLFLWLLLIDAQPISQPAYSNRLLLALLCPLFSLQLFPIAGTQVDWTTLLPIAAAAVLLADGLNCTNSESSGMQMPGLGRFAVRQVEIMLAVLLLLFVGEKAIQRYQQWHAAQPLNLRGSHWLRLPPMETARLTVTVSELSHNCQTVLTVPGLYSFSLWSGVPPVEEKRVNIWPFLWSDEIQKNELPKLQQMNRGCVLVSQDMYRFFQKFAVSPSKQELVPEVKRTMRPIFAIQDVTLYQSSATSQPTSTSALSPSYRQTPADK